MNLHFLAPRFLLHFTVRKVSLMALAAVLLAGCSTPASTPAKAGRPQLSLANLQAQGAAREVVMVALGLLDVGYRFGGNNPEAGLDCSGMVRFIYRQATGVELPHNAAARTTS